MAHTVDSRAGTPANELRDLLDAAERELPALTSSNLTPYLERLDALAAMFAALEEADLRSEQSPWQDLQARLATRASSIVSLAGPLGGFAALRAAHPPATGDWWHLDELVAGRRWAGMRRALVALAIAAGLLAIAAFVYQRFLAPSPETILIVDTIGKAEQLIGDQKLAEALQTTEAALQTLPDDPDLLVLATVLAERLNDRSASAAYAARASAAMANPLRFQLALGMRRIQTGDADGAEQAAHAALELQPNEAQAVFILGNVAEARGRLGEAINYYDQAAKLADASNPQLTVISKMRMATLMQQQGLLPEPTSGATGEATPAAASPTP
jgi:Tfp pilus assembly protein PilF